MSSESSDRPRRAVVRTEQRNAVLAFRPRSPGVVLLILLGVSVATARGSDPTSTQAAESAEPPVTANRPYVQSITADESPPQIEREASAPAAPRRLHRAEKSEPVSVRPPAGDTTPWYRTGLGALGIVLAVIAASAWLLRRWTPSARSTEVELLRVLARTNLTPRHSVALVRVGRRMVLVGISNDTMVSLSDIADPEEVAYLLTSLGLHAAQTDAGGFPGAGAFRADPGSKPDTAAAAGKPDTAERFDRRLAHEASHYRQNRAHDDQRERGIEYARARPDEVRARRAASAGPAEAAPRTARESRSAVHGLLRRLRTLQKPDEHASPADVPVGLESRVKS